MNKSERTTYQAYLLRIWREGNNPTWRAMLESTHTGSRQNFADVQQLISYLLTKTEESPDILLSYGPEGPRSK